MQKKNYSDDENLRRNSDFILKPHRIENIYNVHHTESILDENRCLWLSLIVFYLSRLFGVFKSSFLTYRRTHLSPNFLGILMLMTMILHLVKAFYILIIYNDFIFQSFQLSVIATFCSFFSKPNSTEVLIVLTIYPLCFAISPLIMIAWVNILISV